MSRISSCNYVLVVEKNNQNYGVYDFCKYSKPPVKLCWRPNSYDQALKYENRDDAFDLLHRIQEVSDIKVKVCILEETIQLTELDVPEDTMN